MNFINCFCHCFVLKLRLLILLSLQFCFNNILLTIVRPANNLNKPKIWEAKVIYGHLKHFGHRRPYEHSSASQTWHFDIILHGKMTSAAVITSSSNPEDMIHLYSITFFAVTVSLWLSISLVVLAAPGEMAGFSLNKSPSSSSSNRSAVDLTALRDKTKREWIEQNSHYWKRGESSCKRYHAPFLKLTNTRDLEEKKTRHALKIKHHLPESTSNRQCSQHPLSWSQQAPLNSWMQCFALAWHL